MYLSYILTIGYWGYIHLNQQELCESLQRGENNLSNVFSGKWPDVRSVCQITNAKVPFVEKEEHYYSFEAINQV